MSDLNANDLEAAEKIIAGTARSMGITVRTDPAPPGPDRGRAATRPAIDHRR